MSGGKTNWRFKYIVWQCHNWPVWNHLLACISQYCIVSICIGLCGQKQCLVSFGNVYNTRQKSWNTCVCFPFPMLIWVSQWSQCFKTPVAQHWGGRRHISGGKTVWSRNLRIFPENSRETVSVSTICDEYCSFKYACLRQLYKPKRPSVLVVDWTIEN